jgi:hypothetical protein
MHFNENAGCPYNKMKSCKSVRQKTECAFWMVFNFHDKASGAEEPRGACAIAWNVVMSMNAAKEARSGVIATESFRNEVVRLSDPKTKYLDRSV